MQGHPQQCQEPKEGAENPQKDQTIPSLLPPLDRFATKRLLREDLAKPIIYAPKMMLHLENLIVARMQETTPAKPVQRVMAGAKYLMGLTKWASHGKCALVQLAI